MSDPGKRITTTHQGVGKIEEKFAGQSPYEGKRLWLAQVISRLSNPLFVAPPLLLWVALLTAPSLWSALLWWAVLGIAISAAPLLFIRRGVRQGVYTNYHVSRREQRFIPFLFSISCMFIGLLILRLMGASHELMATLTAMIATLLTALLITQWARWKISLHLIGLSGALTTLVVVIGPKFAALFILLPVIGWARWQVHAHTIGQIAAGSLLGIAVPLAVYGLLDLY
ncbi:hypothetical protein [Paenibacillus sp. 1P07SE]|uniref:hypothetical protein n=1 Tax=Paenibacillus sp. 1P07SE TaxID=3132209 RepID=UPI0039A5521A